MLQMLFIFRPAAASIRYCQNSILGRTCDTEIEITHMKFANVFWIA